MLCYFDPTTPQIAMSRLPLRCNGISELISIEGKCFYVHNELSSKGLLYSHTLLLIIF